MIGVQNMLAGRFRRASLVKKQYPSHYRYTFAIMGGAWVYDASDMCIGWYPWGVIYLLRQGNGKILGDRTPKI